MREKAKERFGTEKANGGNLNKRKVPEVASSLAQNNDGFSYVFLSINYFLLSHVG